MKHTPTGLLDVVRHALNRDGVNVADVARSTGLAFNTVQGMAKGDANPRWNNLIAVANDLYSRRAKDVTCETCRFCASIREPGQTEYATSCVFPPQARHQCEPCAIHWPKDNA